MMMREDASHVRSYVHSVRGEVMPLLDDGANIIIMIKSVKTDRSDAFDTTCYPRSES